MSYNLDEMNTHESHTFLAKTLSPRLVVQVSTIGSDGVHNVAPFASTGIICYKPAILYVGISSKKDGSKKDTLLNVEYSGDFVINVVDMDMAESINKAAVDYPKDVDEFPMSGLTALACEKVKSPRVKESPISFECKVLQILQYAEAPNIRSVVLGQAVVVHIRDGLYQDGRMDILKKNVIIHHGGEAYCRSTDIFEMKRR
ncbi:MAG: flavin reductase family protein [Desulfobacterales bacterium]|nr:flavin reductase family protein [Desulfobacterales bacterium]